MSHVLNEGNWRMTSVLNIIDLQHAMKGIQVVWDIWENAITTLVLLSI